MGEVGLARRRSGISGRTAGGRAGSGNTSDWRDAVFAALKAGAIRQVGYVPDAGHAQLIELATPTPTCAPSSLTTEEEGVALAAGAWLGGQRAALLMQSSGVGNCINMLSLPVNCRMPFLTLVTMRGEWAEFNPWQVPMGTRRRRCWPPPACMSAAPTGPRMRAEMVAAALRSHSTATRRSRCCSRSG